MVRSYAQSCRAASDATDWAVRGNTYPQRNKSETRWAHYSSVISIAPHKCLGHTATPFACEELSMLFAEGSVGLKRSREKRFTTDHRLFLHWLRKGFIDEPTYHISSILCPIPNVSPYSPIVEVCFILGVVRAAAILPGVLAAFLGAFSPSVLVGALLAVLRKADRGQARRMSLHLCRHRISSPAYLERGQRTILGTHPHHKR